MITPATQLSLQTCDVVAHTTWANQGDFDDFRAELKQTWAVHLVQGFDRPTVKNIVGAAMLHGLAPLVSFSHTLVVSIFFQALRLRKS